MVAENRIINALWIGSELSAMELLTLSSFIKHGHIFHLWIYNELKTTVPEGVMLKEAATIIPEDRIFRYRFKNQFGHGEGSLAGFSDLFRYKLLYEVGGWWVDMDVTCLRPLDFTEPYYFRAHHELAIVGNVMKCPAKSDLMLKCFEEAEKQITADNRDWHLPITILNRYVMALGLTNFIKSEHSLPDNWNLIFPFVCMRTKIPHHYYFIHWLNEVWRSQKLDKNLAFKGSAYALLLEEYGIEHARAGFYHWFKARINNLAGWAAYLKMG
jgi:hypothetical protein